MKKILVIALAVSALASCKKTEQALTQVSKIDSDIKVSQLLRLPLVSANIGTETHKLLGWGYDVTGRYADSSAVRSAVINMSAFGADNAGRLDVGRSRTGDVVTIGARNALDLSGKMSDLLLATHGSKFFGGEITDYFAGDAFSTKYVYGSYAPTMVYSQWTMNAPASLLKGYLSDQFKNDLVVLNPEALVKKYGTHILTNIVLGAKLNVAYQAKSAHADRYRSEIEGMRFAVPKTFGISWSGPLYSADPSLLEMITEPRIVFSVTGGDASKIKITTTNKKTTVDISKWISSASEANSGFIDIRENGLLPISDLINDAIKKAAVTEYIQSYLATRQVKLN
ncbi:MAC/perforin domain-containing protein [Mucilaginibacter sp. HD30]